MLNLALEEGPSTRRESSKKGGRWTERCVGEPDMTRPAHCLPLDSNQRGSKSARLVPKITPRQRQTYWTSDHLNGHENTPTACPWHLALSQKPISSLAILRKLYLRYSPPTQKSNRNPQYLYCTPRASQAMPHSPTLQLSQGSALTPSSPHTSRQK